MTRVLLVDDQPLVRAGLRLILAADAAIEVVGECEDGDEVPAAVARTAPDVVVMDIRMRRVGGVEAIRVLRSLPRSPPVLVLTTFDDDEVLSGALRAGASGFQLKDAPGEDLIRAVRTVAAGGAWLDPGVTARVLATYRAGVPGGVVADPRIDRLTERELEVLRHLGRGATNAEIAAALYVSEVTIKSHINHLYDKLGVRDRASAIVFAFDRGIVNPER